MAVEVQVHVHVITNVFNKVIVLKPTTCEK